MEHSWKVELESQWRAMGVPEFLSEIGVSFEESFLQPLRNCQAVENPYKDHRWSFFRLDRLPPGVLHASPIEKVGQAPALWEEWFIEGPENHHHSMRNSRVLPGANEPDSSLLHWRSPLNDSEHPEEVMDVDWHYFNDADQRPYLLR